MAAYNFDLAPTGLIGDHFQVVPEVGAKKLVIYFTASGAPPGYYNFWKPGNEIKTHRIFANNKRGWYQQGIPGLGASVEESVDTIRKWADFLGADEIYTVGTSMGGYGATLFGCLLNARALSLSWESELNFDGSRSRKLMDPGTVITFPDLKPLIATSTKPIFSISGERDAIDAYSLNRLRGLPMFRLTSLRKNLHGPASYLKAVGQLVPLIQTFVDNSEELYKFTEEGDMYQRDGFVSLFYQTHLAHAAKDWERALELGRRALMLMPTSDQCNLYVGEALVGLKRPNEAYVYLAAAIQSGGTSIVFTFPYGNCLRMMGMHRDAIDYLQKILRRYPDHAKTHYNIGLAYSSIGDRRRAGASFKNAASLNPRNEIFKARAAKYR